MSHPRGTFFDGPQGRAVMERVLLVEGPDDAYFFDAILTDIGASPAKVGINYLSGRDNFDSDLGVFLKSSPFKHGAVNTYAIVIDADTDPARAIADAHAVLKKYREPTPSSGSFVSAPSGRQGRVGLLLLPSGNEKGDLEEVCLRTIPNDPLYIRVNAFLSETISLGGEIDHLSKRKVQTYLANKHGELCRGPGRAFSLGHFDRAHQSLLTVQQFCRDLLT